MISEKGATVCGTLGTVCWCVQLIPQIIYNYRSKNCTGLPPLMMFLWVVSGIPFSIYFLVSKANMAVQVQPHLFMFFCSLSFIQTLYYPPVQLPKWKILIICLLLISVDVGMEVGFVLWLRPLYSKGKHWPDLIFGIIASVLLALGLIPPYFELFKRQGEVVGINFIFLSIDSLGAYLSIVSVILGNMDTMGIILYAIVAALELGIFVSHFIWCCRFKWFGNAANKMDCDMESDNSNISTNSGKLVNDNDTCEEIIEDHALHGANFGPTEFEKNENESFNKKKKQFNITDIELSTI